MVKSKSKKSKPRDVFSGTEVGVLVEDFHDQVKLVAENISGIHDKLDKVVADTETSKEDIGIIKMDIEQIKHDLRNKVSYDDFSVLERRVALLESKR